MPISNYPNGFANGVAIRGMPILSAYPGNIYWVDSTASNASNNNPGTFTQPCATIAGALVYCTAGNGDIIVAQCGHAETISTATALILNKSSVAIIGLGTGSSRPTLTFSTAATANIPITAANVSLFNILFKANFADIVSVFTATTTATPTDFAIQNCEFRDGSSALNFISIVTGNATATNLDGLYFANNRIKSMGTTAATTAIKLGVAADRMTITGNWGVWAILNDTAAMLAAGAFNCTAFEFSYNNLSRPNTSSTTGNMISASGTAWTGQAVGNNIWNLDNSAGIWISTGTGLGFNQNFSPITGAADKSGLINPAAV